MNPESARTWLIVFSLCVTATLFLFFVLAPVFSYPLHPEEAMRMIQIVSPVFLGYLGMATQFVFHANSKPQPVPASKNLLKLLVQGPVIIFSLVSVTALFAFGYANRAGGPGMVPDALGTMLAGNLGLLAVTTNVIMAKLFPAGGKG